MTVLRGLAFAVLLVLCGVGIGTVGATVIGLGGPGETWGAPASGGLGKAVGEKAGPKGAGAVGTEAVSDAARAAARKPKAPRTSRVPQSPQPPYARRAQTAPRALRNPHTPQPRPTLRTPHSHKAHKAPKAYKAPETAEAPRSPRARQPRQAPSLPARTATLGVEVVDAPRGPGALVVGVHVPGPGHSAGLVRGDTLLALGRSRIGSAAGLAAGVAALRPGRAVALTVRHATGERQVLLVRPGVVT